MKNRIVITALVLALVLVPCGKAAVALVKLAGQKDTALVLHGAADFLRLAAAGEVPVSVQDGDHRKPFCVKTCKLWQGIVPRPDDAVGPVLNRLVTAPGAPADMLWPDTAGRTYATAARSPPQPAGTAFSLFFARTSRFHS